MIGRSRDPTAERSEPELAIAVFEYKTHVAVDRTVSVNHSWAVLSPARYDSVVREIVSTHNAASFGPPRLTLEDQQGLAARPATCEPAPSQKAAAPADARPDPRGQRN